jgi:hypothetical protein
MRRTEVPLIAGRLKVVDVCRNCGQQTTEIYARNGDMLLWRNDGKKPVADSSRFGQAVAAEVRPGV